MFALSEPDGRCGVFPRVRVMEAMIPLFVLQGESPLSCHSPCGGGKTLGRVKRFENVKKRHFIKDSPLARVRENVRTFLIH
jgi:hypothetical protein